MLYNSFRLPDTWTLRSRRPFLWRTPSGTLIAAVIEPNTQKAWYVVGDKESGRHWKSSALTISGELNRSCTTDLIWGMLNSSYWLRWRL
jgi:hypothetical protein